MEQQKRERTANVVCMAKVANRDEGDQFVSVLLYPDYDSPENKSFWDASPTFETKIGIDPNYTDAHKVFEPGRRFRVVFEPID